MPLTIIRSLPEVSSYTPLSTFQSETPESFSTPVLHYRQVDSKVLVSSDQVSLIPIFGSATPSSDGAEEITVDGVELWVTNENLILFNKPLSVGAIIPYLSLTFHAIQRVDADKGLFMQISLSPDIASVSNPDGHDNDDLIELTLIPSVTAEASQSDVTSTIFRALSTCTSLHSAASISDDDEYDAEDRILFEGDEDDDALKLEGFPAGGGWITAENVDQFRFDDVDVDESATILGPGAGSVRRREEDEDTTLKGAEDADDSKWRRTG